MNCNSTAFFVHWKDQTSSVRFSRKVHISVDSAFKSSNIHAAVKGGANYSTLSGAFVNADQKASQFPLRGKHNMPK